jgi:hypothetical protein
VEVLKMQKVLEKRKSKIKDWTMNFINYYRHLGFLSEYSHISTDYFVRLLMQWNNETFNMFKELRLIIDECEFFEDSFLEEEDQNGKLISPAYELNLLAVLDKNRIWWNRREIFYEGNNDYIKTFKRLSEISRGAFLPENVVERESNNSNIMFIDFKLRGRNYRIHAKKNLSSFNFDLSILRPINYLIADSGFYFRGYAPNDEYGSVYITCLTENERQKIEEVREWLF